MQEGSSFLDDAQILVFMADLIHAAQLTELSLSVNIRPESFKKPELYILLAQFFVCVYASMMLLFGSFHCLGLVCGEFTK